MSDDDVRETPPTVVGAVSIGTAPLPFLAVYAVLFIIRGTVAPAHPPDITDSQTGELIAGLIAVAVFILLSITLWMFLNGRRRWPFVIGQLVVLGTTIYFLADETTGGATVSALVALTSIVSLALGFAPDGWTHVGGRAPGRVSRLYRRRDAAPAGDSDLLPKSSAPSMVEPSSLRKPR